MDRRLPIDRFGPEGGRRKMGVIWRIGKVLAFKAKAVLLFVWGARFALSLIHI